MPTFSRGSAPSVVAGACMLLAACSGGKDAVSIPDQTVIPTRSLGLMEITITGNGSHITSKAALVRPHGGDNTKSFSTAPLGLDVEQTAASTVDIGTAGAGYRYFNVVYKVRNAQYCNTPGTCPAYSTPSNNLTLIAANTASNINNTAVDHISLYDGSSTTATQALSTSLSPTHGEKSDGSGVQSGLESLQIFTESEIASIALDAGATGLFPYGYVVRNINNPGSRLLPASPASGVFDGQLSFSFKLPLQNNAADDPYSISAVFQVVDDANTRVTQSLEEQNYLGDLAAISRATTLGATDVAVVGGRVAQMNNDSDPICSVRIAGTAAAPTAYLANNNVVSVASAPYNLQYLNPAAAINTRYCTPMNAASFSTFVVSGSQSGQRTAAGPYTGSYGTSAKGLSFTPDAAHPFFVGETVSYTLNAGLTSTATSTDLPSFVGSYVVGGTVSSTATFAAGAGITVGTTPQFVASGDFNGDGYPDLAVVNKDDGTVSILLNNGSGGFALASSPGVGSLPRSIAVGDFNGDGSPDLAVTNSNGGTVSILFNNGGGGFTTGITPAAGSSPLSVATGDFNGDGYPDLAVTNSNAATVSILLNNGSGGFTLTSSPGVGGSPFAVAVGDFNGDGHPDLAVANNLDNTVSILLNTGSGGFTTGSTPAVGTNPRSIAVGDFNGDGYPDLAVGNFNSNTVSILLNNGSGGFTVASSSALGARPSSVAVGDFNGDGYPDLAVAISNAPKVSILLNNGSGAFTLGSNPAVGSSPQSVAVGDFSGSHKLGLAVVDSSVSNTVQVLSQP